MDNNINKGFDMKDVVLKEKVVKDLGYVETSHIVPCSISDRCSKNIHGHSGRFEVSFARNLNPTTYMVVDFNLIKLLKQAVDIFDHAIVLPSNISEDIKDFFKKNFQRVVIMRKEPTAECMARWLHKAATALTNKLYTDHRIFLEVVDAKYWETVTAHAESFNHDNDDVIEFISFADTLSDEIKQLIF